MPEKAATVDLLQELHEQDKLILVEALKYWAHDLGNIVDNFDRSDPRRNRGIELAEQLLQSEGLIDQDFLKLSTRTGLTKFEKHI